MSERPLIRGLFRCALYFSVGVACSSDDGPAQGGAGAPTELPGASPSDPSAPDPIAPAEPGVATNEPATGEHDATPLAETRALSVHFRAMVGSEDFSCGATYVSSAGASFTPADLRLFVQDLALITSDGVEEPVALDVRAPWQLANVALLDFEDASGACLLGTSASNVEITGRVPVGEYRGLVFTNGVPESENHGDPARLPPPLQAGSMSWGWLLGYRFLMAEVAAVGSGVADAAAPGSALVHVGSTACSGNPSAGGIVCSKPNRNRIRLPDFDPDVDAVVIDIASLFEGTDLSQVTTCHSSGEECAPFLERVGIRFDDGAPTDRQALYRTIEVTAAAP
jgi:uncharacterized repeat protein (TIGR04052 family)